MVALKDKLGGAEASGLAISSRQNVERIYNRYYPIFCC
jgi:hypothetical protein